MSEPIRVLIVEARFYDDLADELLRGARAALEAAGAEVEVISVPGALEIPAVIAMADEGGRRAGRAGVRRLRRAGNRDPGRDLSFRGGQQRERPRDHGPDADPRLAIGNGILTTENDEQAWVRANVDPSNSVTATRAAAPPAPACA
jgi:6,7-dimethyl-8-ribityllumazine synthase